MKIISTDDYYIMREKAKPMDVGSSLIIIAEDGRPLYQIKLAGDGVSIEIRAGSAVKVGGKVFDTGLVVVPVVSNEIVVSRREYE